MKPSDDCPECNGQLVAVDGETTCKECGLVVATDEIDHGPEWRSFERETRKRTGAPLTRSRHDRGLSTEIGRSMRLTGRKRRLFARLRRQHTRSRIASKAERNRVYAFTEIRRQVCALGLSDSVRDRACVLFESAQDADLLRGCSVDHRFRLVISSLNSGELDAFLRYGAFTTTREEVSRTCQRTCGGPRRACRRRRRRRRRAR